MFTDFQASCRALSSIDTDTDADDNRFDLGSTTDPIVIPDPTEDHRFTQATTKGTMDATTADDGDNNNNNNSCSEDAAAANFAEKVKDRFDVVCFDLDQCAVARHSRGRLPRSDLDAFASCASADFVRAIPALLARGVGLAVCTHSDLAQHRSGDGVERPRRGDRAVVLGDELVHEVLLRVAPEHAHEFFVVAWRPKSRGARGLADPGKTRHVRACAAFYGVPPDRCVLFDDDPANCVLTGCGGGGRFSAYRVDPGVGFRFSDLRSADEPNDCFFERSDGTVDRLVRWDTKWNHEYRGTPQFHLPEPNPDLVRFYGNGFDPPKDRPILLPLCGKTVDLRWLRDQGHRCVVGVEGVEKAIEELKEESLGELRCIESKGGGGVGPGSLWTTANEDTEWFPPMPAVDAGGDAEDSRVVSIVCGDFFGLSPETFGAQTAMFASVFDRGAIVAVPPQSRQQYACVVDALLEPGGRILVVGVDPGPDRKGPPFAVTPCVARELFGPFGYSLRLLDETDSDLGRGAKSYVFLLSKPLGTSGC
ncbi:unnamed protein product [Pseudo-nitzschia multistriata]|uniref:Thiopurine S-methyltransferase n=1 Tax=Pseudo-nitzschia multistriata TaxID=183589 RepID=A0A448YXN0_9STRA|nr:unnamed protein product [Pseudo-nitzschia multistriata]